MFVDAPGAEEWAASETVLDPIEHLADVRFPLRIDRRRLGTRQNVIANHRGQELVYVRRIVVDIFEEAGPVVVSFAMRIEQGVEFPLPGGVAGFSISRGIAASDANEFVEESEARGDVATEFSFRKRFAVAAVDAKRPRGMLFVSSANVACESIGTMERSFEVFAFAGELVKEQIAHAEFADLVGLQAAVKFARHAGEATAVVRIAGEACGERDIGPVPVVGSGSMFKLVIEHAADSGNGILVSGIRIPTHQAVDERGVNHRGVVIEVFALERFAIVGRIDQINFLAGAEFCIGGDFVFDEVPSEAEDVIVAEIFFRLEPCPKFAVVVEHRMMPWEFGVDIGLREQCSRTPRREAEGEDGTMTHGNEEETLSNNCAPHSDCETVRKSCKK